MKEKEAETIMPRPSRRPADHSWSGRVGSGQVMSGRVGSRSGRVGLGRVGWGRVGLGQVGSGQVLLEVKAMMIKEAEV